MRVIHSYDVVLVTMLSYGAHSLKIEEKRKIESPLWNYYLFLRFSLLQIAQFVEANMSKVIDSKCKNSLKPPPKINSLQDLNITIFQYQCQYTRRLAISIELVKKKMSLKEKRFPTMKR